MAVTFESIEDFYLSGIWFLAGTKQGFLVVVIDIKPVILSHSPGLTRPLIPIRLKYLTGIRGGIAQLTRYWTEGFIQTV
jgi:hypothetical protein